MKWFFLLAALSLSGPASSQADERIGVWQLTCSGGPCQMFFSITSPETDDFVIGLSMIYDTSRQLATLVIRTPKLTALPPGARVTLENGETNDIEFQFCDDDGCSAFLPMTDGLEKTIAEQTTLNVAYIQYGRQVPTAIEVPIEGFKAALERLER